MSKPRRLGLAAALAATVTLAAACSGGDSGGTTTTRSPETTASAGGDTTTTSPPVEGTLDQVALAALEIARVDRPTALVARPSSDDLYVAEQGGIVRVVEVTRVEGTDEVRYELEDEPLLDLSEEVLDGGERGLLGLAFSTDGRSLYLDLTAEPDGRTVVLEYAIGDRGTIDLSSRRVLLEVEQPYANHNGGHLATGRDGYLYVGLGDGGDRGDPHGHGQDPTTLLGSILRIDPEGSTPDGPAYAVPAGNPFADGEAGAPEIWLYGVRNPWRFSFDRENGDLWVADVGQGSWEEITRLPAVSGFDAGRGANLGWDRVEGSHEFEGDNPSGAVLPIHEYSHDDGCSITGGFVYRGDALEPLRGAYLFADYCEGGLRAIQVDGEAVIDERAWDDIGVEGAQSFGEDLDGEVYVLLQGGPVLKLVPPSAEGTP